MHKRGWPGQLHPMRGASLTQTSRAPRRRIHRRPPSCPVAFRRASVYSLTIPFPRGASAFLTVAPSRSVTRPDPVAVIFTFHPIETRPGRVPSKPREGSPPGRRSKPVPKPAEKVTSVVSTKWDTVGLRRPPRTVPGSARSSTMSARLIMPCYGFIAV